VIVDCPHCHTSNAENEGQTSPDGQITCRGCGKRFRVPNASEIRGHTTQVARTFPTAPSTDPELFDPDVQHERATAVVQLSKLADGKPPGNPDYPDDEPTMVAQLPHMGLGPDSGEQTVVRPVGPHNVATGIMTSSELHEHLLGAKGAAPATEAVPDRTPPEPQPAPRQKPVAAPTTVMALDRVRAHARAWIKSLRKQPLGTRIAAGTAGVLVLLLVGIGLRLMQGDRPRRAYLAQPQPLLGEPMQTSRPASPVGSLKKGAQVTVYDEVGNYVMVRDLEGRVGYVVREVLTDTRPDSGPDSPFVDCKPAPNELDNRGCEERSESQWESCRTTCERADATTRCHEDCRGLYRFCLAACHGEAVHPEPEPPAIPPPGREPTPAPSEPATAPPHPALGHGGVSAKPKASSSSSKKADKKKKH
jgi:hypothetical protein